MGWGKSFHGSSELFPIPRPTHLFHLAVLLIMLGEGNKILPVEDTIWVEIPFKRERHITDPRREKGAGILLLVYRNTTDPNESKQSGERRTKLEASCFLTASYITEP